MLDYKTIITQHYALHMSGREIASGLGVSKSGVNDFLNAFKACKTLHYPRRWIYFPDSVALFERDGGSQTPRRVAFSPEICTTYCYDSFQ